MVLLRLAVLLLGIALAPGFLRAADAENIRYLFLVRHGDYDSSDLSNPVAGPGLNALGKEQAAFVASRLAALPITFDTVVASQLARARETGDIIAAKLGHTVQRDANLSETRPPGDGVPPFAVVASAEAQLQRAWNRYVVPAPPGAVTHDLLICHGNVIRWFVVRALGADPRQWSRMEIGNASITVIEVLPNGSTNLLLYNDTSHIPVGKQSWVDRLPDWAAPPAAAPAR